MGCESKCVEGMEWNGGKGVRFQYISIEESFAI